MTLLRLASASEGRMILAAEDDFTRGLGGFDRSFRMRTTAPVDDAELRRFLGEQAVDFTAKEGAAWEETITTVAEGARGIGGVLPREVLVVKTTGREERDHPYTRANAIVLPASRVQSLRGARALRPPRSAGSLLTQIRVRRATSTIRRLRLHRPSSYDFLLSHGQDRPERTGRKGVRVTCGGPVSKRPL